MPGDTAEERVDERQKLEESSRKDRKVDKAELGKYFLNSIFNSVTPLQGRFISTGSPQVYFGEVKSERGKCLHLQEMKHLKIEDRKGGAKAGEAGVP